MELNLTTWQRVILMGIVSNPPPPLNLPTIRKASKLLDVLELTVEEREAVGLQGDPTGNLRWADAEHRWALELDDPDLVDWLKWLVENFEGWPVAQYEAILDLCDQLGIKEAE